MPKGGEGWGSTPPPAWCPVCSVSGDALTYPAHPNTHTEGPGGLFPCTLLLSITLLFQKKKNAFFFSPIFEFDSSSFADTTPTSGREPPPPGTLLLLAIALTSDCLRDPSQQVYPPRETLPVSPGEARQVPGHAPPLVLILNRAEAGAGIQGTA